MVLCTRSFQKAFTMLAQPCIYCIYFLPHHAQKKNQRLFIFQAITAGNTPHCVNRQASCGTCSLALQALRVHLQNKLSNTKIERGTQARCLRHCSRPAARCKITAAAQLWPRPPIRIRRITRITAKIKPCAIERMCVCSCFVCSQAASFA